MTVAVGLTVSKKDEGGQSEVFIFIIPGLFCHDIARRPCCAPALTSP